MINAPVVVVREDFQEAWLEAVKQLMASRWELRNLVVQIKDPGVLSEPFHDKMNAFAEAHGLIGPLHVAYTIFPHRLYRRKGNATDLFSAYNRPRGLYDRIKTGWGTYFRRMTSYEGSSGTVNQLGKIIVAIRNRKDLSKAAYTIVIQNPGGETVRPVGGPCLNYLAVQADPALAGKSLTVGLLAVYRNHDFLERAYGNYWGLCNLLMFLAKEVDGTAGPLTCVSSHAYVQTKKTALMKLVGEL